MYITYPFVIEGKLQSSAVDERHTVKNLARHLQNAISDWGLDSKVIAWVHDNVSNIVLAHKHLLEWESVFCFAQTARPN